MSDSLKINQAFMEASKHNRKLLKRTAEIHQSNNTSATITFDDIHGNSYAVKWNMGKVQYLG